ncbi:caspase family protein [Rhodobacteraceae bacterium N5(2021)]|uniref:Caspase family protein n=1 Tax=Gymnodinialimonas phycosphaerae TaxID=2841589 RepID=A0A975TXX2_9RHOB|nr:caspase family protein [Gymnodinialimonas phycosphaerae]MBY4892022.1 caspase family protein [Gymnodinialimonas phycosphaerae]
MSPRRSLLPAGRILFALCLCLSLLWSATAHAQTRHAFVVGIDTYENVGSLEKARNDARAVAGALEEVGFRTQLLIDVDETALLTELTRFSGQLNPGDEVVFYFAGHGVEINGRNYLLPADVPSVAPGQELVVTRGALPDAPTGSADPCAAARADWSLIGETPGVALLEAYRTAHSGCPLMMMLASERLAALTATPAPSPPAATLEPTHTPAHTPSPQGDVSVPVQACVAAADPDHTSIADLRADAAQATARARCAAALVQITDRASAEGTHVLALLGRAAHAAGNFEEAVSFYEEAAHANPMAASNLGSLYQTGRGVAADGARAAELFQSAGELGAAYGWHNYASLYYRGEVVPLDYDRAAEAYLRAAQ